MKRRGFLSSFLALPVAASVAGATEQKDYDISIDLLGYTSDNRNFGVKLEGPITVSWECEDSYTTLKFTPNGPTRAFVPITFVAKSVVVRINDKFFTKNINVVMKPGDKLHITYTFKMPLHTVSLADAFDIMLRCNPTLGW